MVFDKGEMQPWLSATACINIVAGVMGVRSHLCHLFSGPVFQLSQFGRLALVIFTKDILLVICH
ncbi:MAG: hypothetical protein KME23_13370 [Goleter apudmare HA4340-LM2]|nr:hypothetical protein [Goleter apudmare HA4340-LM2]